VFDTLEFDGINNNLGEFITFKGVENEYNAVLSTSESMPLQTLVEILEIENNNKEISKIVSKIQKKPDVYLSKDGTTIFSKKI